MAKINILIINGSCGDGGGNTERLLDIAVEHLSSVASISRLNLANEHATEILQTQLRQADGFIFGTGTYWDSWGSPLQRFFEKMTATEGSELWLGKPTGVVVTMHSVGGKGVLSRIQGVLNTFGVMIPPMSGIVYSAANQLAITNSDSHLTEDFWRPEDINVICHNLMQACLGTNNWRTWPLDRTGFGNLWVER